MKNEGPRAAASRARTLPQRLRCGSFFILNSSFFILLLLAGCTGPNATSRPASQRPARAEFRVEAVASNLEVPWSLAFAPDGRLFVTERPGRIRVIEGGALRNEPWATLDVYAQGEAGLMGIALSPGFAENRHVYVVGTFRAGARVVNRIVRFTDTGGKGADRETVVDDVPGNRLHAGDAIAFGPDGMLWAATGEVRQPRLAQDRGSLAGKILRYTPDGGVPSDNPIANSPVYALGLRNPQGLAWHPHSGQLFATEHGPSGFPNEGFRRGQDELDAIREGGNYGWPKAAGRGTEGGPFVAPVLEWTPAIAPAGLAFYRGDKLPWDGQAFVACLRGKQLRRIVLERGGNGGAGWKVTAEEAMFQNEYGRIRAVAAGPDGFLYFTTSNRDGRGSPSGEDDRVLRIIPRSPE